MQVFKNKDVSLPRVQASVTQNLWENYSFLKPTPPESHLELRSQHKDIQEPSQNQSEQNHVYSRASKDLLSLWVFLLGALPVNHLQLLICSWKMSLMQPEARIKAGHSKAGQPQQLRFEAGESMFTSTYRNQNPLQQEMKDQFRALMTQMICKKHWYP